MAVRASLRCVAAVITTASDTPRRLDRQQAGSYTVPAGAAAGCDLLILILKNKIKRSQLSAAPAGLMFVRSAENHLYPSFTYR
jgi:hypothetical protein